MEKLRDAFLHEADPAWINLNEALKNVFNKSNNTPRR